MPWKRLRCKRCGVVCRIWRQPSRNKPAGHIKSLWCYRCKQRVPHVELNPHDANDGRVGPRPIGAKIRGVQS
jgi:hypothetical protein